MKYSKFDDVAVQPVEDNKAVPDPGQVKADETKPAQAPVQVVKVVEKEIPSLLTARQKKRIEKKTKRYEYKRTIAARKLDVDKNLGMSAMKVVQYSKKIETILLGITLLFNLYYYFGIPIICYIFQLDTDLFDNYAEVLEAWNKYIIGFSSIFLLKSLFETKWERQNNVDLALGAAAPSASKGDDTDSSSLEKVADTVSKITDVAEDIMDKLD